jgi:TatD DNase family protein
MTDSIKLNIFDSHCHLDDNSYEHDLDDVIQRAHAAGVTAMMAVGVDEASSKRAVAIARGHDSVYASVGMHPHDAKTCSESILARLKKLAMEESVKAWGETGLDFNRMYSPQKDQELWFARQLEIGAELNLPMIFHERDSQGRFLSILKSHWNSQRQGVVHCFSGTSAELDACLEQDLYIGITGILTIQSRGLELRKMAPHIPENRLLIETDAPYLTPAPERNKHKRNEPAFVRTVLFKLAELLERDPEVLARILWENTCRFFGI